MGGIHSALTDAVAMPREILLEMGLRGRELVKEKYSWEIVGMQMVNFYREILAEIS